MNLLRRETVIPEDGYHGTSTHRLVRDVPGQGSKPHVASGRQQERGEVVGPERPAHADQFNATIAPRELPSGIALNRTVDQRIVMFEFDGNRGLSPDPEVFRRGHQDPWIHTQGACTQRRIRKATHANRQIDSMLDKIDITVIETDIDLQSRIQTHEADDHRCHHPPPKRHRGVDSQRPLHLGLL